MQYYHDVLMMSINLSDIVILKIHGVLIITVLSMESKAINLLQKADLSGTL